MRKGLPSLIEHHDVDLVIANAENAAAGRGITREIGDQLLECGRRRHDLGQSHLGTTRGRWTTSAPKPVCFGPPISPPGVPGQRQLSRPDGARPTRRRHQRHGARLHAGARRSLFSACSKKSRRCARARGSFSSTSTPRRRPRRWRWDGTSTAKSRPSSARTHTCRRPTSRFCQAGRRISPTSGMTGPHDGGHRRRKIRRHR